MTTRRTHEETGRPTLVEETRDYSPPSGRGSSSSSGLGEDRLLAMGLGGNARRIEDVTELEDDDEEDEDEDEYEEDEDNEGGGEKDNSGNKEKQKDRR